MLRRMPRGDLGALPTIICCVASERDGTSTVYDPPFLPCYGYVWSLLHVRCMVITYSKGKDQPGKVANPALDLVS